MAEGLIKMASPHYIALIHKDPDSGYGISFPDVPGVTTVADSLEEALEQAADVLHFALEDWPGGPPPSRTLDELHSDSEFRTDAEGAVVAAIRPKQAVSEAAE